MQALLIPQDGGETIELDRDITVVGRKNEICDLCIDRNSISKLHCLIVKTDGLLFVRDLGSTNGTKVNGQRVTRGALLPGDELAFASVKYRVFLGPSKNAPVVSMPSGDPEATEMMRQPARELLADLAEDEDDVGSVEELLLPPGAGRIDRGPLVAPADESDSDVRFLSDDSAAS